MQFVISLTKLDRLKAMTSHLRWGKLGFCSTLALYLITLPSNQANCNILINLSLTLLQSLFQLVFIILSPSKATLEKDKKKDGTEQRHCLKHSSSQWLPIQTTLNHPQKKKRLWPTYAPCNLWPLFLGHLSAQEATRPLSLNIFQDDFLAVYKIQYFILISTYTQYILIMATTFNDHVYKIL